MYIVYVIMCSGLKPEGSPLKRMLSFERNALCILLIASALVFNLTSKWDSLSKPYHVSLNDFNSALALRTRACVHA